MKKLYCILISAFAITWCSKGINAQAPQFFYNDTICHDLASQIGIPPTEGLFYIWSPTAGLNNANSSSPTLILPNTSEFTYDVVYTLNVVDLFLNQIEQHIFNITVSPVIFTSMPLLEQSICLGDTITIPFLDEWPLNAQIFPAVERQIFPGDSIRFFPSDSRDYTILYPDSAACIIRQRTVTFEVFEIPDPSIDAVVTSFCLFDSLTVSLLLFPNGGNLIGSGTDSAGFFRPHVAGIGTHTLFYRFDNPGCEVADSLVMTVFGNPEISMNLLPAICANAEPFIPQLASPEGGVYFVNGEFISTLDPAQYNIGINTLSYTLLLGDNCISTDSIFFNIIPPPAKPNINISPEELICEGKEYILTSSFFTNYEWSTGDTSQSIIVSQNGFYFVDVISGLGCKRRSDTISIEFVTPFNAILNSPLYPNGFNVSAYQASDGIVNLEIENGLAPFEINWSTGANNIINLSGLPEGEYFVYIIDAAGCTDSVSIIITGPLEPEPEDTLNTSPVLIPNGFTPNSDGINDLFVIKNLENFNENSLSVYNRYGNKVFQQSPYLNDWNGIGNRGSLLPPGTYYYILNLDQIRTFSGFIDLRY